MKEVSRDRCFSKCFYFIPAKGRRPLDTPLHVPHILQELQALIKYIEINKATDLDWFTIKPTNKDGTHWQGKCWYVHELIKYEFDFQVSGFEGRAAA